MLKNNKSIRHELLAFMLALVMIIGVILLAVVELDPKLASVCSFWSYNKNVDYIYWEVA